MPVRLRQKWYLKEWRKFRGLTQQRLADRIEMSKGYISQLEKGDAPYNQDLIEGLADALNCDPADLIMRDPTKPDAMWTIYDQLEPAQRKAWLDVGRAMAPKKRADGSKG